MTARPSHDDAFREQLAGLIPSLRAFGRSLSGSGAQGDQLAQHAMVLALASRAKFRMGADMKAWVFMILRNLYFSDRHYALQERAARTEGSKAATPAPGPLPSPEFDELRCALAMLSDEDREALILIGAAGLSYEEASEVVGAPADLIRSRVDRARSRMSMIYADGLPALEGSPGGMATASLFLQVEQCCLSASA